MTDFFRYQRQLLLPQMDEQKQEKMFQARVLVVGVGGLGCPVLTTLTTAGVGHLGLVDFDRISLTNLHRQHLFFEEDVGKLKTEVAKSRLEKMNSQTQFSLYSEPMTKENIFHIISEYDLVVDCTDNFPTRYLLNDVCFVLKKTLIYAAIYQNEGQLSVFNVISNESEATNLRDIFPEIPNPQNFPNCNEAGVMGVLTAIMGSFQANEVIKFLIESKELFVGKMLLFNSLNYQTQTIRFKKNNSIHTPNSKEAILTYDYGTTCFFDSDLIRTKTELDHWIIEKKAWLVDIRNPEEKPRLHSIYPNVLEVPMAQLEANSNKLNKNSLVFVCQTGVRSKKAMDWAKKTYPNTSVAHIEGGIGVLF